MRNICNTNVYSALISIVNYYIIYNYYLYYDIAYISVFTRDGHMYTQLPLKLKMFSLCTNCLEGCV